MAVEPFLGTRAQRAFIITSQHTIPSTLHASDPPSPQYAYVGNFVQ